MGEEEIQVRQKPKGSKIKTPETVGHDLVQKVSLPKVEVAKNLTTAKVSLNSASMY